MINIEQKGNFENISKFLSTMKTRDAKALLDKYGKKGVALLEEATPVDTGETSMSWSYEVNKTSSGYSIDFENSNVVDGVNIAIILQYGHGTKNGGYVEGIDYINPAIEETFTEMAEELWGEVVKA